MKNEKNFLFPFSNNSLKQLEPNFLNFIFIYLLFSKYLYLIF